jgi:Spy/CpxP family protein refolding chaperone
MRKFVLVLLTVLFVTGLAVSSGAVEKEKGDRHVGMYKHDYGRGCCCDRSHSPRELFRKLGLDEKQKEAVREIHFKAKKAMIMKKADIKVARIELQEILSKDSVDMTAAEAAIQKIESLKSQMKMARIKAMEEVKSNLNADQKKKFIEMIRFAMMRHEMMRHGKCHMHGKKHMEKEEKMEHEHHS